MKSEKELIKEIDEAIEDVKNFREDNMEGIEQPQNYIIMPDNVAGKKIEKTIRQLKRKEKYTFKTKLQINKKKYALRQETWYYGEGYEDEPTIENLRGEWYITNGTMKSILKNHKDNILIRLTGYFDGMIDCQTLVPDAKFTKLTEKFFKRVMDDLSRRGLMSCFFDEKKGIFKAWSCCDDWEFALTGVNVFYL